MRPYSRPAVAERTFTDSDGRPIPYGSRWGAGSPPDDTYSVVHDSDRFSPLHTIAGALVEWLVDSFDVTVEDAPEAGA